MRKLLLTATALVAVATAWAPAAEAAPDLSVRLFQDGVQSGGITTSNTGALNLSTSTGNFNVVLANAIGFPAIPQPRLQTSLNVTAGAFTAAPTSTLRVEITQTGLNNASASIGGLAAALMSTFTQNFVSGGLTNIITASFVDTGNTAFGQTTALSSLVTAAGTPGTNDSLAMTNNFTLGAGGLFSETVVFQATFAAGAGLGGDIQLRGTPVPEPMSLALFGMGLAGLGLVGQRRKA